MKRWLRVSRILGILGLSGILMFVFSIPQVHAKDSGRDTFSVNCDLGQSIQDAVDKADDGAVINVSGTCTEHVAIDKNRIWLRGQPGASISVPEGRYNAILVVGSSAMITDFGNIEGAIEEGWIDGIGVYNSGSATISNNVITSSIHHGIDVSLNGTAIIENNLIIGSLHSGVYIAGTASARIWNNIITNNTDFGIGVFDTSFAIISGNTISDNGYSGIDMSANSSIIFPGWGSINTIEENVQFGVICGVSGVINIQIAPDFGDGNGNDPDLKILPGCDCSGLCP